MSEDAIAVVRNLSTSLVTLGGGLLVGHFYPGPAFSVISVAVSFACLGLATYALVPRAMRNAAEQPEERDSA